MKTNVHPNSFDAYIDLIESGELSATKATVVDVLKRHPGITRETIATLANMKESSVCGRIRELIDANLVEEVGTTKNRMGTKAATLALKEKFYQ